MNKMASPVVLVREPVSMVGSVPDQIDVER